VRFADLPPLPRRHLARKRLFDSRPVALERLLELLSASSGQDHAGSTSVACYSLAPHQPGLFDAINEALRPLRVNSAASESSDMRSRALGALSKEFRRIFSMTPS
jgi:hypothetical protein